MGTSERACERHVASGQTQTQRQRVYEFVYTQGEATGNEINRALGLQGGHVRAGELVRDGYLAYGPERPCLVTGASCQTFRVLEPLGPPKRKETHKKPKNESLEDYLEREEVELKALRGNVG